MPLLQMAQMTRQYQQEDPDDCHNPKNTLVMMTNGVDGGPATTVPLRCSCCHPCSPLLCCHIARGSCCPCYGWGSNDQGGDGVAKGGADNDYDKDDPSALSPGGARAVGEQGNVCVQGKK